MTLSMRRIFLLGAVALIMTLFAGLAQAQPADDATVGPGGHPHHVHTGDGGCHNLDSVLFEGGHDGRGLHLASFESGGPSQGPWHGTCELHIH